jgi:L-aminoadipate-semialdehyde dehydrogenase
MTISQQTQEVLTHFDLQPEGPFAVTSPIDGSSMAGVQFHTAKETAAMIEQADSAFKVWRQIPAPRRAELVRLLGEELRKDKEMLARLVTLECGKLISEGRGEVQEMIDICDFAVGLSRQLYGLTIASERPGHHMRETWHPLGVVAVISAFNFPVAVWAWNVTLALVCGNAAIWKPSEKTPLTALACAKILDRALARFGDAPDDLHHVLIGDGKIGAALVQNPKTILVSATGSTPMGRKVGVSVAERFGKSLLELGGNAAMILSPSADLDLALRAITFSALGTSGQRCTTLRRLIIHEDIYEDFLPRLKKIFASVKIGNPLQDGVLMGPLIDESSLEHMQKALAQAKAEGGAVTGGEAVKAVAGGAYASPAIVEMKQQTDIVRTETFAPILYVMPYCDFDQAIAMNNDVPQGLSSCIFTLDVREAEQFLSDIGSDCGIANVNIGSSGAEIGGAFGGEKETGGGRESGSDAWKAYMRRQTNTVNWSRELPLAQGVEFEV